MASQLRRLASVATRPQPMRDAPRQASTDELLAATVHELRLPLSHIKGFVTSLRRTDVEWDDETRTEFLTEIELEADRLAELIDGLLPGRASAKPATDLQFTHRLRSSRAHFTGCVVCLHTDDCVWTSGRAYQPFGWMAVAWNAFSPSLSRTRSNTRRQALQSPSQLASLTTANWSSQSATSVPASPLRIASAFSSHFSAAILYGSHACPATGLAWRSASPSLSHMVDASRSRTHRAVAPLSACPARPGTLSKEVRPTSRFSAEDAVGRTSRYTPDGLLATTNRRSAVMTQQSILVVDDEAPMRKVLSSNLRANGYAVRSAADGTEALKLIEEHAFDLLLLDINIPGPNGLQVLEAVRRGAETPVLMLSGRARERDTVEALDLGADDYISKPFGVAELLARVKALLRRVTPGPKGTLPPYRYQGLEVDFSARRARVDGVDVPLTRREFEVLAYLARNAGKVLLHRQVLHSIWGGQYGEESDYVWTFVQRIRRKIEPDRARPRYVLSERGVGYRMPTPEEAQAA
jgi:two-component system, OmpR family, KDP operon response regulator KdpE